jgi:predicted phage tail component-like protein
MITNIIKDLPYFIFNNCSSLDYLILNKLPPIIKPAKDVDKIEIPGRDGFLTNDLGTYRGFTKTVECTIINLEDIDFISQWLSGGGEVVFSNEPDKKFKAVIINQIDFVKILQTFRSFIILFDCQPYKYAIDNNPITILTPQTIVNGGTKSSLPILKIYGNGNINLVINGNIINLTNVSEYLVIDSELMDAYKDTMLKNNEMNGEFPELRIGANSISWTGSVTKVEITPNWRYI